MGIGFVEYLRNHNHFPASDMAETSQFPSRCSAQIIENLSGYKVKSLSNLTPCLTAKIINILENHLKAEREKAAKNAHHYNSNRHIGLLQALRELKTKKTQPDGGCVIS